jgi:hypothetical protein
MVVCTTCGGGVGCALAVVQIAGLVLRTNGFASRDRVCRWPVAVGGGR